MAVYNRIAILGLGLIGSSLARAIAQHKLAEHIAAFDMSGQTLHYAMQKGFIHSHHAHAGQAVQDADLIIFASPPATFESLAKDIAPFIKPGTLVTDVASVKRSAIASITKHLPNHAHYVPGHPITGSERIGVEAGRADLFAGKLVILTPEEDAVMSAPVAAISAFWKKIDAKIEYMPAFLHDRIYAFVSHLPQLVAFAAWQSLKDARPASNEIFSRFTRLAKSDPKLWADICTENADYIGEALGDFIPFATQIMGELSENTETADNDIHLATDLFPKVVATCLIGTISLLQERTGVHPVRYSGAGFADMTAPALDDPEAALAAISAHHNIIAQMLETMLVKLREMEKALSSKNSKNLAKILTIG